MVCLHSDNDKEQNQNDYINKTRAHDGSHRTIMVLYERLDQLQRFEANLQQNLACQIQVKSLY